MTTALEPWSSCRYCSSHGPTVSLLDGACFIDLSDDSSFSLADAVSEVAQVSLNLLNAESRGSMDICVADCLVQLESCYRFRERVQQVESTLRRFESAEIKLEIIEEDENQFDEEEFLEEDAEDGRAGKFVMPSERLIVTHLAFEHFDYVEFRGERCCGCELICATGEELRDHVRESHTRTGEVSELSCSICRRNFSSLEELNKHRESYSTTKELLVCKLCQVSFLSKESLMLHMDESLVHRTNDDEMEPEEEDDAVVEPPPAEGLDIEIEFTDAELEESKENPSKLPEDKLIHSIEDFDQHRIITVVDGSERCCACGVYFQSTEQLLKHATREHHKDNRIEGKPSCDVCLESFSSPGSLSTHKTFCRHVKKLFYCKLCQLVYIRKFQIVNHFKHTPNHTDCVDNSAKKKESLRPKKKQCGKKSGFACCFLRCSVIFENEPELMAHVEEQHAPRRVINFSQRTSEEFVCTVCQRNFSSHQLLLLHRNRTLKKKHICSHCGEPFLIPSKLREHEQLVHSQSASPKHPCEICGKSFRTPNLLKAHQQTHDDRREFACDQCPARFKFRFQLRKHQIGVHPTAFPFECAYCEKKFAVKAKHDLHVRSHTGAKPFVCRYESCGKQFSHVTDRKRHEMSLHTGERPYRCEHCLAGFVRKRELLIHAQKHQLQSQEV